MSIIGELERQLTALRIEHEHAMQAIMHGGEDQPKLIMELRKQLAAAQAEVARLRAGLERLGNTSALSYCGLVQTWRGEEKARIDFARQLLQSPAEKGQVNPC
jgi:DNA-binding MarR family transcriptional regulator